MGKIFCPSCGDSIGENESLTSYTSSFNNQNYKLYHCLKCDLRWWEPLKVLPEFYEEEGNEGYVIFHQGLRERISYFHIPFFKHIPLREGRLLDIGCGDGVFLKEARKLGFEVWGIDFDRKSIKIAKEKFGLENVFSMSLEEFVEFCKRENLRFDIITFFEVPEHQDNPKEFLHQVKSILKPGGYIAGSVPNSEAIKGLLYYSPVNLPPHHFLWFTKRALVNLFNTCFEIDKIEIYNVKLSSFIKNLNELSAYISFSLGRKAFLSLREDLKKATIGKSYYTSSSSRKLMFKLLKGVRNGIFMPLALIVYPFLKGFHFYFQFQVKS